MARRPKPVKDLEDATTWLAFMSRFCDGDLGRNAGGVLDVLLRLDFENSELRNRNVDLARKNETLEAQQGGEGL